MARRDELDVRSDVVLVREIRAPAAGDLIVLVQPSSALHYLRRQNPRFSLLLGALADAREQRRFVHITKNDDHEILDVRATQEVPFVGPLITWADLLKDVDPNFVFDPPLTERTPEESEVLFRAMKARGQIGSLGDDWIPFGFPDEGCVERAHRMCELLMSEHQTRAGKIWLYTTEYFRVSTPNNPWCYVIWEYHVAPVVRVNVAGATELKVIDPSLTADRPVTIKEWFDEVSSSGQVPTVTVFTNNSRYDQPPNGVERNDATFDATPQDLLRRQRTLLKRIEDRCSPPPYCWPA